MKNRRDTIETRFFMRATNNLFDEDEMNKFEAYRANQVRNYMITDFCDNINELDENLADKLELFDEKYTNLLPFHKRVGRYLRYINFKYWSCIVIVATLAGFNGLVVDRISGYLFKQRLAIVESFENQFLKYIFWTGTTLICALTATYLCDKFSKEAEGSGVPEIKTYLSGLRITQYISFRSYLIKFLGLILVATSGFFIGKEGPLIQMSTMIAKLVCRFPYFKKVNKKSFYRNQMLIVSVAAGVCSTFGACYGGLMFAIEICTSAFLVTNLYRAFICSVIVKLIYSKFSSDSPLIQFVEIPNFNLFQNGMIYHSILIGLVAGWLGSLWIYLFCKLKKVRSKFPLFGNRYQWLFLVSVIIATITFVLPTSYQGPKKLLGNLWYEKVLQKSQYGFAERTDTYFIIILITLISRYFITLLFAASPIPNGVFLPSLIIGGLLGRFYGEFVALDQPTVDPRAFAMIGAASFASAITRTTSVILIVTELTESSRIVGGLLIGVAVAYSTSNTFTMSFFDTVLTLKKMPYLPILFSSDVYKLRAKDVCDEHYEEILYEGDTIYDLIMVLNMKNAVKFDEYIPVLDNKRSRKLKGAVRKLDCFEYLSMVGETLLANYGDKKKYESSIKMLSGPLQNALRLNPGQSQNAIYGNISDEFHNFVESLKGRQEQKLKFDETFQIVEVEKKPALRKISSISNMIDNVEGLIAGTNSKARSNRPVTDLNQEKPKNEKLNKFLKNVLSVLPVDWNVHKLKFNRFPASVNLNSKLVQVHYLFQMLGVGVIFVVDDSNILYGKISREDFINLRYKESDLKRYDQALDQIEIQNLKG